MMLSVKKALVVGSGSIAKRHIQNLKQILPNVEVICMSSSGRSLNTDDVGSHSTVFELNSLLLDELDLAIIASPATYHASHALPFIKANIPVLIEKPLCSALSEVDDQIFFDPKAKIGVGYNIRFLPAARKVKELLGSQVLGHISTAFAEVGHYLPDWRQNSDYRQSVSSQKILGGGALLELSHELDYLYWFFGDFHEVSSKTRNSGLLDIDVEDTVDAMLVNKSGMLVNVHLDFLQRTACRRLKVVGEYGTLIWNLIANEVHIADGEGEPTLIFSEIEFDRNTMYLDQLKGFLRYAHGKSQFSADIKSSMKVMQLIEAIRMANQSCNWVKIKDLS